MPMSRIEIFRDVAKNGYRKVRIDGSKVLIDGFTASAVVQVYDALNDTNKAKFVALPLVKMVDVTWKLVNGGKNK